MFKLQYIMQNLLFTIALSCWETTILLFVIIILLLLLLFIIELTHSKTILENTVEIEPQPVALDFKNLSQYSSRSK